QRVKHVEVGSTISASAVGHARHHEQSIKIFNILFAAELLEDAFVISDTGARGYLWVAPAMILDELSTSRGIFLQVGIHGVEYAVFSFCRTGDIGVEVEGAVVPSRIAEDNIFEQIQAGTKWLRTGHGGPAEFAAALEGREDDSVRTGIFWRRVNCLRSFRLTSSEA